MGLSADKETMQLNIINTISNNEVELGSTQIKESILDIENQEKSTNF